MEVMCAGIELPVRNSEACGFALPGLGVRGWIFCLVHGVGFRGYGLPEIGWNVGW